MSTFRENTYTQFATDKVKLTTANGYSRNYTATKGYLDAIDVKEKPHICYLLGGETLTPANESATLYSHTMDLILTFYFACNTNKLVNEIIDVYENIIEDAKKFIHGWATNHFDANLIQNKDSEKTIQRMEITEIGLIPVQNNTGSLIIIAKLTYLE